MRHITRWGIRKIGGQTLLVLLLLAVVFGSAAAILVDLVRGLAANQLIPVTLLALPTGWWLARSKSSGRQASLWVIVIGLGVNLISAGKLTGRLLALWQAIAQMSWEILHWQTGEALPNTNVFLLLVGDIAQNVGTQLAKGAMWFSSLLLGGQAYDILVANLTWGLLLWVLASWASWAIRRREQPMEAILPAGVLLAACLAYARANALLLAPILGGMFLLLAARGLQRQERHWQQKGIDYAEDIHFDTALWVSAFTLGILGAAALISFFSPQKTIETMQKLVQPRSDTASRVGESLGLEMQPQSPGSAAGVFAGSLPRLHLLGGGSELSQQIVMTVRVDSPGFLPPQAAGGRPAPRYYWRALAYDIYTGRGWATSETEAIEYQANELASTPTLPGHLVVQQEINLAGPSSDWLYATGSLVTAEQAYRIDWRKQEQEPRSQQQPIDMFGAKFVQPTQAYQATSLALHTGAIQLRAAGEDYPQWVLERYLGLPASVPARVIELARDLTEQAATPYDRALALETHLRSYTYTLDVPAPPPERDVADYFLFDLQKGYCDYYATTMAVWARAVGLPARLVMGYASGSYDIENGVYIVSEMDAHSWVEIYFPGTGWVEFEPTGGLPAIERPQDVPQLGETFPESNQAAGTRPSQVDWLRYLGSAGAAVAVLGFVLLAWLLAELWRFGLQPAVVAIPGLYRRLYHQGQRLRLPLQPGSTPHEFATALCKRIERAIQTPRWARTLAPASEEARQLVNLYARTIYSPHLPDTTTKWKAIRTWQKLRYRLWMMRLLGRNKSLKD